MKRITKAYTYEEVEEILDAKRKGLSSFEISKQLEGARSADAIRLFNKHYEAFLSPNSGGKYPSSTMLTNHFRRYALEHENQPIAEQAAEQAVEVSEPQQPVQEATQVSFDDIKNAYAEFGKLIRAYIASQTELEVEKRLKQQEKQGEEVAKLHEEIRWWKEENQKLKQQSQELKELREFKASLQGLLAR